MLSRKIVALAAALLLSGASSMAYATELGAESIDPAVMVVTHRHVNDKTIAGFRHARLPIISVQYHPEACPGPRESAYLFDEFLGMMRRFPARHPAPA